MLNQTNLKSFLMATICALLTGVGCSKKRTDETKKVVLNVQNGEEIRHLDPQLSTGIGSSHVAVNLFQDSMNTTTKQALLKDLVFLYQMKTLPSGLSN